MELNFAKPRELFSRCGVNTEGHQCVVTKRCNERSPKLISSQGDKRNTAAGSLVPFTGIPSIKAHAGE
jgi:hypothetical protein